MGIQVHMGQDGLIRNCFHGIESFFLFKIWLVHIFTLIGQTIIYFQECVCKIKTINLNMPIFCSNIEH
jgi:hypothetical protein